MSTDVKSFIYLWIVEWNFHVVNYLQMNNFKLHQLITESNMIQLYNYCRKMFLISH